MMIVAIMSLTFRQIYFKEACQVSTFYTHDLHVTGAVLNYLKVSNMSEAHLES